MKNGPVLYVHPYNHVVDDVVPMGAVALMNRVSGPKMGRYAWELTEADIASASVVAMDLHWYFSIEAVHWIARDVKRIAPDVPIVLGGITASFYARHLLATFPIDYVVVGDGEHAFPRLVESLREGRRPLGLPNVWSHSTGASEARPVRGEEYDENDYLTLDWFPGLASLTRAGHAEYARAPFWGRMDRFHPYVPLNRGCRFPCNNCFGSYQRDVFGPGQVDRSAASLERLLDRAEAHGDYRFVSLTAGTEDVSRVDGLRTALGRRRKLGAYVMHFCDLPSDRDLELILGAFERVCMDFTNPDSVPLPLRAKGLSSRAAEDRIFAIAKALDGRDDVRVGISFMSTGPHPFKDRLRKASWDTLEVKENSEWTLPRPNHATLEGDLPDHPVPGVERVGLSPREVAARDAAKARQAEQFREVSRGHAHYIAARAISPALHPLLDQSYLQHVDGTPITAIRVEGDAAKFLEGYVARYQRWYVTTLPSLALRVTEVRDPVERAGLTLVTRWGDDLGPATLEPRFDGLAVRWRGETSAPSIAICAVLPREDGGSLDPRAIEGLVHWVLPVPAAGPLALDGCVSAAGGRLSLTSGRDDVSVRWDASALRPPTPFDVRAAPTWAGPGEMAKAPLPDPALAERLMHAIDQVLERGLLPGWRGERVEGTARWTAQTLTHEGGTSVRVVVIAPGVERCMISTPRARVLLQPAGLEPFDPARDPHTRDVVTLLEPLLGRIASR